jgi:hypothetical protein
MIHSIARLLVEVVWRRDAKRTLLRAARCLCTCGLVAMRVSQAQVPTNLDLTGPTISSGTFNYMASGDIRAEASFIVNGSAKVTFTAGQTIHLEPGFRATAGSGAPTFHALIGSTNPSGPIITSLTPSSGAIVAPVTIAGTNFGTAGGTITFFSGAPASYMAWGNGSINTSVPNGAVTGPVVVTAGGVVSNAVNFTVTAGSSTTTKEYIRLGGRVIAIETTIH